MDSRIAAVAIVLCSFIFLLNIPSAQAGVCILPAANNCINSTHDTTGPKNTFFDGTDAEQLQQCTAAGGSFVSSTSAISEVPQCTLGCCCGTQVEIVINAGICTTGYTPFLPGDTTCQQTCAVTSPPPRPYCGEGTIEQTEIDVCSCGRNLTQSDVNKWCCLSGEVKNGLSQCTPQTGAVCAVNQPITSSCLCGPNTEDDGACCAGGIWKPDVSQCTTPPTEGAVCGNDRLDAQEACDARYIYNTNPAQGATGWVNVTGVGCTTDGTIDRTKVCTTSCTCAQMPAPTVTCGNNICDAPLETSDTCSADCPAIPVACTAPYPPPENAYGTYYANNDTITLHWSAPVGCSAQNFAIYRMLSNSSITPTSITQPDFSSQQLSGSATTFTDTNIPSTHKKAYYAIVAYFQIGGTVERTETIVGVNIPNSACPVANASYCYDATTLVECTNYNNYTTRCDVGGQEICARDPSGVLGCIQLTTKCEECNGLFGMFPNDNYEVDEQGVLTACKDTLACYKDLGRTSTELYKSCSQIDSCVGYKTETACEANECRKGGPGGCEWLQLSSMPWKGVCRAAQEEFRRCSDCDDLDFECTAEMCLNIGNGSCYYYPQDPSRTQYTPVERPHTCYDLKNVACEMYTTQVDCTGTQPSNFTLNTTYTGALRTAGDNFPLTLSNDLAGHGKCSWNATGNYCYKDADFNNVPDDREKPGNTARWPYLLDFTNPVSTVLALPNQLFGKTISVPFASQGRFYVQMVRADQSCYPPPTNTALTSGNPPVISRSFTAAESGLWKICFYSEDNARNLEQLKSIPVTIDAQPPRFTDVTNTSVIIPFNPRGFRTAYTLEFEVDEQSSCWTRLYKITPPSTRTPVGVTGGGFGSESHTTGYGTSFSVTYPLLTDGIYSTTINCTDDAGNSNVTTPTFTTDSNFTISSPSPVDPNNARLSPVSISIRTERTAVCRYGTRGQNFNVMTAYAQTSGTLHNATVSKPQSGVYTLQTACDFGGTMGIVYGNETDDITFVIDHEAPTTILCAANATNGHLCNRQFVNTNSDYHEIALRCADNPSAHANFGCAYQNIRYCTTLSLTGTCTLAPHENGTPVIKINDTRPVALHYQSIDEGGNLEPRRNITLRLVDITAPRADFTLSTP